MALDFSEFFRQYEALVASVDKAFAAVQGQHPAEVVCQPGCSDCCHALFDLSLVEALYLNTAFNARYSGKERDTILTRAEEAEREQHKVVRQQVKARREGVADEELLANLAGVRIRCPLLESDKRCALYEQRPITCRLYGVPTAIGGKGHTCGLSGFKAGQPYPTVHLEKIQDRLVALSQAIHEAIGSRYAGLPTTFAPLATALMNTYDEAYLGVGEVTEETRQAKAPTAAADGPPQTGSGEG